MTEPLRIPIRSDWDAALTYDSLDEESNVRPVFVGRETLIAPLVAEICEPNKRGTYLISGYRGTGKTSLVIEALSRAKTQLPQDYNLFPLVLNVSEVSASLGGVVASEPGANASEPSVLFIDSRRLLIALLRAIAHRIGEFASLSPALKPLADKANNAYEKATAAKFARTITLAQETTRSRSRELVLALEAKSVLKMVAWAIGAMAVAFEAAALVGPRFGWLHAAALALGAACAISIVGSIRRSSSEKQSAANQTALEYDNSLQQLETDLKDILTELKQANLRTIVVMEELDKIEDQDGKQLASVIRYFKNLFTQAPALFFFVTDKSYFDVIASAIKRARRARSYAVEHTFFTHRLFVGRATTEESLKFIENIVVEPEHRAAVAAVAQTLGKPGRTGDVDPLGRFVRVVLFSAVNHMFDLKNELRRFVRNEGGQQEDQRVSSLLIDDQTLPPERAAVAVFQDLIIEKTRSFEIKGGRVYANETLADSLYAVFNELGSNRPQSIPSFLPPTDVDPDKGLLLDEQLDLNEAARVREAVDSLIDDLARGRALTRDSSGNTFTWSPDAARAFRYVRQLAKHEESLIAELQRHAGLATSLIPFLPSGSAPMPIVQSWEKRAGDVREAREPVGTDAAAEEQRSVLDRYAALLNEVFTSLRTELEKFGFMFESAGEGLTGSLYFVKPVTGDPRFGPVSPRGGVLLAFGETETLLDDVWSFVRPQSMPTLAPLDRFALVHVIHAGGDVGGEVKSRRERWEQELTGRAGPDSGLNSVVEVIALTGSNHDPDLSVGERITVALLGRGGWSRHSWRQQYLQPLPASPEFTQTLVDSTYSEIQLLHIVPSPERYFTERQELEKPGLILLGWNELGSGSPSPFARIAEGCMQLGFDKQLDAGVDSKTRMGDWLVSEGPVILYFKSDNMVGWTAAEVALTLKAGARVIFVAPSLPPELQSFRHKRFPPDAAGSETPHA